MNKKPWRFNKAGTSVTVVDADGWVVARIERTDMEEGTALAREIVDAVNGEWIEQGQTQVRRVRGK